ncbi:MAG: DUF86 domain-containing protein [Alphaproteobacteria bacterium]|nr:DUF86 domain-containing protein [Alphaproteobacteria bacterium]
MEATRLTTSGRWLQRRQERVIGMRKKLIHHYAGVALDLLWQVTQKELPRLAARIGPLVPPNSAR